MTQSAPTTIPMLVFRAGELQLAIVAAAVVRVSPVSELDPEATDCAHVATLLKLPSGDAQVDRRMMVITCAQRTARLIVEGPIRLTRIGAADLLPLGRGLRLPVLVGFAQQHNQLVLLLHIALLAQLAEHHEAVKNLPRLAELHK